MQREDDGYIPTILSLTTRELAMGLGLIAFVIVEGDLFSLDIGLKIEQVREILRYRADMDKKAIDINYKIDMQLIDLQVEMFEEKRDSAKINNIVLNITDLGTQLMDNRVVHFLEAKDVLTIQQKKALLHIISMM